MKNKITLKGFLNCFKEFDFNILTKKKKDSGDLSPETVRDSWPVSR